MHPSPSHVFGWLILVVCLVQDVDKAVTAAKTCMESPGWGYASTGKQRAVILRALGGLFEAEMATIAAIDSVDMGKPMREAEADVGDAVAACKHFADLAEKLDDEQGEKIDVGDDNFQCEVRFEPMGVIGAITPWNYPFLMAVWKVRLTSASPYYRQPPVIIPVITTPLPPLSSTKGDPGHRGRLCDGTQAIGAGPVLVPAAGGPVPPRRPACWCTGRHQRAGDHCRGRHLGTPWLRQSCLHGLAQHCPSRYGGGRPGPSRRLHGARRQESAYYLQGSSRVIVIIGNRP